MGPPFPRRVTEGGQAVMYPLHHPAQSGKVTPYVQAWYDGARHPMIIDAASGATQEERAMSYGQGGYRQPDLRPGMPVQTDTGWEGQIVEVIPAPPGYDGTVRVQW